MGGEEGRATAGNRRAVLVSRNGGFYDPLFPSTPYCNSATPTGSSRLNSIRNISAPPATDTDRYTHAFTQSLNKHALTTGAAWLGGAHPNLILLLLINLATKPLRSHHSNRSLVDQSRTRARYSEEL